MKWPKPLQAGDRVALLAPSGPCEKSWVQPAAEALEQLGLTVHIMESCHSRHEYLAGPDNLRAGDLNEAFANPAIRGIFALRGGYGCQRLLPHLDYAMISQNPKIFAGYSDTTALHTALNQFCQLITFHAPMPATELRDSCADAFTRRAFTQMIFGYETLPSPLRNPLGRSMETVAPGRAEGRLTGGNLSLLSSSIGTPFEIDTADNLLFIEEINEDPYRIDRMLLQLKLAGKFRDCTGIILGYFTPHNFTALKTAVRELLIPEQKPILAGLACGHGMPTLTLPLGAAASMDATGKKINFQRN